MQPLTAWAPETHEEQSQLEFLVKQKKCVLHVMIWRESVYPFVGYKQKFQNLRPELTHLTRRVAQVWMHTARCQIEVGTWRFPETSRSCISSVAECKVSDRRGRGHPPTSYHAPLRSHSTLRTTPNFFAIQPHCVFDNLQRGIGLLMQQKISSKICNKVWLQCMNAMLNSRKNHQWTLVLTELTAVSDWN